MEVLDNIAPQGAEGVERLFILVGGRGNDGNT
jgi:hypothetical protein